MSVGALMGISVGAGGADFTQNDYPSGAPVDAECTPGAGIVVDGEDYVVAGVVTGKFGAVGFSDGPGLHHVDAFPWTDVDAAFAHDAFGLVDVNELFGFNRFEQPVGIYLMKDVVVDEGRKWRVGVYEAHAPAPSLSKGRPYSEVGVGAVVSWPRSCQERHIETLPARIPM